MGSCLSCFRDRKRSEEREPLLPEVSLRAPPPSRSLLEKTVDALAGIQAGKLPSQEQTNTILRSLIASDLLRSKRKIVSGPLRQNGVRVLDDMKGVLEAVLRLGMEKNMDDVFQELLYQCSQIEGPPVHVNADPAVKTGQERLRQLQTEVPTNIEMMHDTANLVMALKQLARVLLTSAAFRFLLSDIFSSIRDGFAQVAAQVGQVALNVQVAAEGVEKAANVDGSSMTALAENIVGGVGDVLCALEDAEESTLREHTTKDKFITRLQELIVRAHQDRHNLEALRTILDITRKYASKLSRSAEIISKIPTSNTASAPSISVTPKDELAQAMRNLKVVLERLASGHSLDPLIQFLSHTVASITENLHPPVTYGNSSDRPDVDLQQYLHSVDRWLTHALAHSPPSQPFYATSRSGTRALEQLYDGGQIIFLSSSATSPTPSWAIHLSRLLDAYDAYAAAFTQDRSTTQLLSSLLTLQADLTTFASVFSNLGAARGRAWKDEALRDLMGYVLPRIMEGVGQIKVPMPRVEYKSGNITGALDALKMGPGQTGGVILDVLPDQVIVRTENEIRIDMAPRELDEGTSAAEESTTVSSHLMQVHVDGVRVAVKDLGYFFAYGEGPVLRYADQGLLSVDVGSSVRKQRGRRSGSSGGVSIDIDLALDTSLPHPCSSEVETDHAQPPLSPLFDVKDVRVALSGVQFHIDKSKHWILNKLFVQPLARPIVSRVVASVLEDRLRTVLEKLAMSLALVKEEAQRFSSATTSDVKNYEGHTEPTISDYWEALLQTTPKAFDFISAGGEDGTEGVETHTSTTATLKGLVHTTTTSTVDDLMSLPQVETETSIAIGAGAMMFPDQAGPYAPNDNDGLGVIERVAQGVNGVKGDVEATVENAMELRQEIEGAEERRQEMRMRESARGGWRSRVFDI